MSKKMIFAWITSVAASLVGGFASGYFYMKKKFFKEYEIIEDSIVPLESTEVVVGEEKKEESNEEEKAPELPKTLKKEDAGNGYRKAQVDYSGMSKNPVKRNPEAEGSPVDDYLEPHVISKDEFDYEMRHYSKITVYYYSDNVMIEEGHDGDPEYDGKRYLGMDVDDIFGAIRDDSNDNPDVAYVRNDRLNIDYEVIKQDEPYVQ